MSNKPNHLPTEAHPAFAGFRRDNLLACYSAIGERVTLTRAELAQATGLSVMTAGKIADAMIECGILCEEKLPCAVAGRRPGKLRFSDSPAFLILGLYCRRFTAHVLSPGMQAREICTYDYNDVFPYDDNVLIFLNTLKRSCNVSSAAIPYLALITAPEPDVRESITRTMRPAPGSQAHLVDYVSKILRRECDLVIDEISAAQSYLATLPACKNADCGVFISLSDMSYAAVWMRGNLQNPRLCRIGELLLPERKRVADALADALCTQEAVLPTAYAVSTLESFFTPDCVMLESCRFGLDEAFIDNVYEALRPMQSNSARTVPLHLLIAPPCAAVCGCATELRRSWFYEKSGL